MSRNRGIVGPHSALTDYLAAHNISAYQIAQNARTRRRAATGQDPSTVDGQNDEEDASAATVTPAPAPTTTTRSTRSGNAASSKVNEKKRKLQQQKAFAKSKRGSRLGPRRAPLILSDSEDDGITRALYEASAPLPGQMENCANCGKRFTVTPYTRADPNGGGLLCSPCGKEVEADDSPRKKKKAKVSSGPVGRRRKLQSEILDGTYHSGAKNLVTLCVEQLARNIDLADDLGELPDAVIDKIARMLSKRRMLNPQTINLFLQPSAQNVRVYDGARLSSNDYMRIFQTVPGLKRLKIRNAIQFKDDVMDYLVSRDTQLEDLSLHGANLVSDDSWANFLLLKGEHLKSLKVYFTDKHVTDSWVELVAQACTSLRRLKIYHNQQVSGDGLKALMQLGTLEHLSLHLHKEVHPDTYVNLLQSLGTNMKTFSLVIVPAADNTVLDAIHTHCRSLKKLRITESEHMTDEGFARLFRDWANPPLEFVDFEKCRHLDSNQPRTNQNKLGFCSDGFRALMAHSGSKLQFLNLHACRHISAAAFEDVFGPDKTYPELKEMEISFCEDVTDFIVGSIFRSCPNIRKLNVFGCMKVRDVRVPRNKILVGVPNAVGMQIEGVEDADDV